MLALDFKIPAMHIYGDASLMLNNLVKSISSSAAKSADDMFSGTAFKGFLGFGLGGEEKAGDGGKTDSLNKPGTPTQGDNLFTGNGVSLIAPAIGKLPSAKTLYSLIGSLDDMVKWVQTDGAKGAKDYFKKMGFLQGDGDIVLSMGRMNLAWTGHGGDVAVQIGDWNRLFSGKGNDISVQLGNYNAFAGGEGDDIAIAFGSNNLIFTDEQKVHKNAAYKAGNDIAFAFGQKNYLWTGEGTDFLFAFGDENKLKAGGGDDILIAIGNKNDIESGDGNDFIFAMGAENTYKMGGGVDYIINFGNVSVTYAGKGSDFLKLGGSGNTQHAGDDNDLIVVDATARDGTVKGDAGDDTLIVGGSGTTLEGGSGSDRFVIGNDHWGSATIADASGSDWLVLGSSEGAFNMNRLENFWLTKTGDDLKIHSRNGTDRGTTTVTDYFKTGTNKNVKLVGAWWTRGGGATPEPTGNPNKEATWNASYDYRALDRAGVTKLLEVMSSLDSGSGSTDRATLAANNRAALKTAWLTNSTEGSGLDLLHLRARKA